MEKNVCGTERIARLVVGTVLLWWAYRIQRETAERASRVTRGQVLAAYAGADLFLTGVMQWCPTNHLLGVNTCRDGWKATLRSLWSTSP